MMSDPLLLVTEYLVRLGVGEAFAQPLLVVITIGVVSAVESRAGA